MMAADLLHTSVHGLVLSGVPSPCRGACSANAFAWHFALYLGLHSVRSSGAPITAWLAADLLRIAVQPAVFSGGSSRLHGPCRRAWRACAFARHTAQHPALHSMQPSHVQMSCLEHGRPVAVTVFAGALAAGAAAPPGRDCRKRMREANAEGKIEGCGTTVRAKPVCTWVGGGTRPRAASCRLQPPCLAGIGNTVCRIRSGAMGLSGAAS
jgi:hypothetical protein